MFGFSVAKLILLVGIIIIVIYGSRFLSRVQEIRQAENRRRGEGRVKEGRRPGADASASAGDIEDMVKCRVCGAYVAAQGALGCGQANCPYGPR
jgi:hypothetical protein